MRSGSWRTDLYCPATGGFTKTALQKAAQIPHVTTVDGDQLAALMVAKAVGLLDSGDTLDEHLLEVSPPPGSTPTS
jgi:restriction endonuclease Mrr